MSDTCADCGRLRGDAIHESTGHEFVPVWDDSEPHVVGQREVTVVNYCRCHGDGWILDDDLDAAVCPDCDGVPTRLCGDLARHLAALVEAHRGNRSGTYSSVHDFVPIAVLEGLLAVGANS